LLISDVNEYLGLDFPSDEADTLSGLILSALGRAPHEGEEVAINGLLVRVERMMDLGVTEISIPKPHPELRRIPEWETASEEEDADE
jgi:magnesium and cobalt transporter